MVSISNRHNKQKFLGNQKWVNLDHQDHHRGKNHLVVDQYLVQDRNIRKEIVIVLLKENHRNIVVRTTHQILRQVDTSHRHHGKKAKDTEDMIPVHHRITDDVTEDPAQIQHLIPQAVVGHQVHHQPANCIKTNHHLHMLKRFVQ